MSHARTAEYFARALQEIEKGMGRFSRDPLTHAENTIEDMQKIAHAALDLEWDPPELLGPPRHADHSDDSYRGPPKQESGGVA